MKRRRFRPRGKSLRTKTNQLSVRRLPLPPRVCGPSNLRDDHEILGSHALQHGGVFGATDRAHSPRAGVGSGSPPVPSPARRRPRASVSARAPGPRSAPAALARVRVRAGVERPDPPLRRAPIRRDGPIATRSWIRRVGRARAVPPFSRRDAPLPRGAVLVVRAREARGGLEAGLRQSDAHERLDQHPRPRRARRARQTIPRAPSRSRSSVSRSAGPGSELALVSGSGARTAGW